MKRKKVFIFTISPGGVTRHISILVSNIDKDKFIIKGMFPLKSINQRWRSKNKNEYQEIFESFHLDYYVVEIPRNISIKEDIKALIKIVKILIKEKPDVLHCHSSMAGFIGRIAGKFGLVPNIIYTPHTVYYAWLKGIKKKIYFWIEKFLIPFCNYIVAVSPSEEEYLKKTLKTKKIIRINNGINVEEIENFKADIFKIKNNLGIDANKKIILTITRLSPPKDTFTLIKAIELLKNKFKNFVLLIAGDGEQREKFQEYVLMNNLNNFIKFLGWRDDIFDLISICDIAVLSSEREGLPYAIIEPSAFGKPVIGTNTYGIKDCIIHEKTGYLFNLGDCEKLCEYIHELLTNEKKAKIFGENGKKFVKENFNAKKMVKQIEKLYET